MTGCRPFPFPAGQFRRCRTYRQVVVLIATGLRRVPFWEAVAVRGTEIVTVGRRAELRERSKALQRERWRCMRARLICDIRRPYCAEATVHPGGRATVGLCWLFVSDVTILHYSPARHRGAARQRKALEG
jgi:hypothetical protein